MWSSTLNRGNTTTSNPIRVSSVLGQPEHPLGENVLHDLLGAAEDAQRRSRESKLTPGEGAPLAGVGSRGRAQHRRGKGCDVDQVAGEHQLENRCFGAGLAALQQPLADSLVEQARDGEATD